MTQQELTRLERTIDRAARRILAQKPASGARAVAIECVVFLLKQAWACIFGALLLAVIVAARLWYPDDSALARNDALTLGAIAIQLGMLAFRLESGRELWVIVLFHLTGTVMELFKTDVGSWSYETEGFLRIGAVPLFSGFMYAAVGSYMVRVYRLHDLRFSRYPRVWLTTVLAALIYANFFTHHFIFDLRWVLLVLIAVLWGRTVMHFRIWRARMRAPQLLIFAGGCALHLDRRKHRDLGGRVALPEPRSRLADGVAAETRLMVLAHDYFGGHGHLGLPAEAS